MNRLAIGGIIALGVVLLVVVMAATFTVHQSEQALVVQFGEPRRAIDEPGLHFKIPFVQDVLIFDKRVLDFDAPTQEIPTLDQKQVLVNAFAKFRIVNSLLFFQTVRNIDTVKDRLGAIISSNLRQALGRIPMQQILTAERATLMAEVSAKVSEEAKGLGIEVMDVRMKRVDLPPENSQAIFRRMQTQREQEAKRIRAEGDREKQTIRAEGDKQQVVIVANARRQSEILRGEGDGLATAIYNAAYGRDTGFFDFFRSMQAMRQGLQKDTTTFVGPTSGEFFRYFGDSDGNSSTFDELTAVPLPSGTSPVPEPEAPAVGTQPGVAPDETAPAMPAPDDGASGTDEPGTGEPEAPGSDAEAPAAPVQPDEGAADGTAPDATAPDATAPDATGLDVTEPEGTTAADAAEPAQSGAVPVTQ